MKAIHLQILIAVTLITAAISPVLARPLAGAYLAEEQLVQGVRGAGDAVSEVSIWHQTKDEKLLVCKIVKQHGLIVSIMPTPIQTDAIRPTAHFVTVGNGWTPSTLFYLEERGKLYRTHEDAQKRQNEVTEDKLTAILKASEGTKLPNVYLTVEQNTEYDRFEEVFRSLAPVSQTLGVGWQKGWW